MKGKKVYYLSGAAVLFVLGLLTLVLVSGHAENSAQDDALNNANPSSITSNSDWSEKLGYLGFDRSAGQKLIANEGQRPTREQLQAMARLKAMDIAAKEGRLDEYLAMEQQRQDEKAEKERIREERRQRNKAYGEAMKEYHEKARAAREAGLELPEKPRRRPADKEVMREMKEVRKQEKMERNKEREIQRQELERLKVK